MPSNAQNQAPTAVLTATMAPTTTPASPNTPVPVPLPTPATPAPVFREPRTVPGISVVFTQSQQMPDSSVAVFENILATWFDAYFNRRRRRRRQSRRLQAVAGIQNMNSQIEVTDQTVSNVANIVTFTQTLNYDATAVANETTTTEDLLFAPWNDTAYNRDLAGQLTQMIPDAFGSLGAPISPPVIVDQDSNSKSEDSSTNPALYSLAALALIPMAGVAYFFYRKQSGARRSENAGEPVSVTAMRQTEDPPTVQAVPATPAYLPVPKDQCRHVPLENRGNDPPLASAVVMDKETMSNTDKV